MLQEVETVGWSFQILIYIGLQMVGYNFIGYAYHKEEDNGPHLIKFILIYIFTDPIHDDMEYQNHFLMLVQELLVVCDLTSFLAPWVQV